MPEEAEQSEQSEQKDTFETFDKFVETLDEPVKELYNSHISGLKNALESEKDNRRKLAEQIKSLTPAVEKGSELEAKLAETAKQLEEAEQRSMEYNRRATFAEQAIRPGVNCANVKAAYALAVSENLFSEDGNPKWKELQKLAPELFRISKQTDAGNQDNSVTNDINAAIRRAAGI